MRVLAAVDTVHTAAALCDYLGDRLDADDEVVAVTVHPQVGADGGDAAGGEAAPGGEETGTEADRDRQEALNVVDVRLPMPDVETVERRGDPGPELLAAADEHDVDELVLGARAGTPGTPDGVGSTAGTVLASATRPAVVVPLVSV